MPFVIFVGGLLEYNSGKSTIAKDIIDFFEKDLSLKTTPLKPLSGNNLYYHYDLIKKHVRNFGNLVSLDIMDLILNSSSEISQTIANPVHRVSTQALAHNFFNEGSISTFYSKYSGSETLLQRFTSCQNNDVKDVYLVNEPIYKNQKFWNDISLTEPILEKAKDIKLFKNDHEYYSLNSQYYAEATKSSFDYINENSSVVIIESFNNSAHPAWCIRESDVIFLVGPGSLFIYEPETYFRAIDNFRSINRNKPTTTEEVLKLATPKEAHSLQSDKKRRKEALRDLLQEIYGNQK